MHRIRVGTVGYLNSVPLTEALDPQRFEVIADHPRGIALALAEGRVDVALAPVAAVLTDGDFRIVPGFCIGALGAVHSVLLVAETPPEQWRRIVLDGESRTSVVLARVLLAGPLADRVRDDLEIVQGEPGDGLRAVGGDVAALVIGDAARVLPETLTVRLDLGELWTAWTGLPFVFAVWAGRPDLPPDVVLALRAAGALGVGRIAHNHTGADLTYLSEHIRYPLDEPALMGLRRFAALAHRADLIGTEHVQLYPPPRRSLPRPTGVDDVLFRAAGGARLTRAELELVWSAPLSELGVAAHTVRAARHDPARASYLADDAPETCTAHLAIDPTAPAEAIDQLLSLRDHQDSTGDLSAVRVSLDLPTGALVEPGRATTASWLRVVALARLALDNVDHLEACCRTQGLDLAQAALFVGCDDLGPVSDVEAAERALRVAGLEPVRRDASWEVLGGAVTAFRKIRRPEDRAAR